MEQELLQNIYECVQYIAIFVIARFGWVLYFALIGGIFRLDKEHREK